MEDLIPVNVWLAGRSYRIRIPAEEEAAVRSAVKAADKRIAELRQHYAGKDDQDFVAMCLLMYATDNGNQQADEPSIQDRLTEMITRIDTVLDKDNNTI